jgi:spore germination protein GerM
VRRLLAPLLVLVLAACGVPQDAEPRVLQREDAPFRLFEDAPEPAGDGRVALYFVRDDLVVLQTRAVERSTSIRELLDLLLEGPTPEQVAAGTRSALPTTFDVEDVVVSESGVAVVTLGGGSMQVGASPLGFAQVVATLTAPGRARAVRFRLDGEDLPVPRGDGSLTTDPLDRDDYAELLALPSPVASPAPS